MHHDQTHTRRPSGTAGLRFLAAAFTALTPSWCSHGGPATDGAGPKALFSEEFGQGAAAWKVSSGTWEAKEGAYVATGRGTATAGDAEWTDYAVEARLRTDVPGESSWDVGALLFRFTERENAFGGDYYYLLLHKRKNLELGKRVGGKQVRGGLSHVRDAPPAAQWNSVRVELRGGFIRVFVNGELGTEVNDPDPLPSGRIGLMSLGAVTCRFDDIRVTDVGPIKHEAARDWPGLHYRFAEPGEPGLKPRPEPGTWPAYRYDSARSGVTSEPLAVPLHLQWVHTPRHPPRPAWPEPGKELHRLPFDYAFEVTIADGLVFYGSSADHQVHALDLATGEERWRFFTQGPVRFAPAVAGQRLFAASDDGWLYCLGATDGRLLWRFRGGPRDERFLGNGQMISRWPGRSGVLIDGGAVFFTAGMWSPDGVYAYALRPEDGSVIWRNDTCGVQYMKMPHDYLEGIAGVSPQGYMLMCRDTLVVPNGRAMPAGFDRRTGELRFCRNASSKLHHAGGSWNMASGGLIIGERHPLHVDRHVEVGESEPVPGDGLIAWAFDTGDQVLALAGKHRAVVRNGIVYATGDGTLTAVKTDSLALKSGAFYATGRVDPALPGTHVHPMGWWRGAGYPWYPSKVVPVYPHPAEWEAKVGRTYEVIAAGDLVVAAGRGTVAAFDSKSGKKTWEAEVDGQARGLAAASGRLVVSLSTGQIICFGPDQGQPRNVTHKTKVPTGLVDAQARAREVLVRTGVTSGYCLLFGAGDGRLACELARQSDLVVYCVERDDARVIEARRVLSEAGLYGVRVAVHHVAEGGTLPYADYFANVAVLDPSVADSLGDVSPQELYRVLRPCGGSACIAPAGGLGITVDRLREAGVPANEIVAREDAVVVVRGPLPGAGAWTHAYADAGRSAASAESLLRLPLGVLWFGGPGPDRMVSRHWRTPGPLFANGRMFVSGEHHLIGVDAYNGRELWARELPGVGRFPARYRGGSTVVDESHVYALVGNQCLQLDPVTGVTVRTYDLPPEVARMPVPENPISRARGGKSAAEAVPNELLWEFLATAGDVLVGSAGAANVAMSWWPEAYPECGFVFAVSKRDGVPTWLYRAERSVPPNAIVIGGDRLFLIDRTARAEQTRSQRRGSKLGAVATLRCLSLASGEPLWQDDITASVDTLQLSNSVLLASGGRRFEAWDAKAGGKLWKSDLRAPGGGYPVITGDTLYVYPHAYELRTGKPILTTHPLTGRNVPWEMSYKGGCGSITGCESALFFRSGATGMVDLAGDSGLHWLGQVRPSCWVNMVPAGGMLLYPEGASNCSCPYNYQTSLAMVSRAGNESWSVFPERQIGRQDRIRHVRLNLGAVGDRRDRAGDLWLAYPRPFRAGGLYVPMTASGTPDFFRLNADAVAVEGTERPWIYTSACRGPLKAELDLVLKRPAVALACEQPPTIDGRLGDACWDGREPLAFTSDDQVVDDRSAAYLRCDADALYIAFRCEASLRHGTPVAWTANTAGTDAPVWADDSLNVRLRRGAQREGLYLSVSASGATFDGHSKGNIGTDKAWDGEWRSGVQRSAAAWSAEMAVPWDTLAEAGITRDNLTVYLERTDRTGVGPERTQFKYRPYTRLWCFAHPFTTVTYASPATGEERRFRAVLHFAEPQDLQPGQRVFDVKLQGQTVIEGLDIVREAGGPRKALLRQVDGIHTQDSVTLELVPRNGAPPVICAVELYEEP